MGLYGLYGIHLAFMGIDWDWLGVFVNELGFIIMDLLGLIISPRAGKKTPPQKPCFVVQGMVSSIWDGSIENSTVNWENIYD